MYLSNFKFDYDSLYSSQTKLRECQFEIKQLLSALPKISFESDDEYFKDNLVGSLSCSFPNTYYLVKSSGTHEISSSKNLCRMQYLANLDKIVITDSDSNCLKIVDINNGHLIQSTFNLPSETDNLFKHPFSICVDSIKNEIFVSDIELSKVFIFDKNLELLRTLCNSLIKIPNAIRLDNILRRLYVGDYTNNLISIWDSESCDFIEKIEIESPAYIELDEKSIYVLNSFLPCLEQKQKSLNCIFILEKAAPNGILQQIKLETWQNPCGLFIKNDFFFTVSNEISSYSTNSTDNLFLFVFNKYGYCVQKTKLNQYEAINDLFIVDGTLFLCFKNFLKIYCIQ
jgi:hypothetical protein